VYARRVDAAVASYLENLPDRRRRDAETLAGLMGRATAEEPRMWGSIVGFGSYHYRYASGREGDAPAAGFAARKRATTIYLADGVGAHEDLLARLGPHTTGVGCLYVKDLAHVDLEVLETIVRRSYSTVTAGVFGARARDSGTASSE
jgi:Domain of unknown function (DU1801)